MNQRRSTRRGFLGALAGGAALLGMGRLDRALAERRPGHGSKEIFKSSCEQYGGVFVDSPKDKLTICIYPDGSKSVCDSNGNDCINYPPPKPKPATVGGGLNPVGGVLGEIGELPELVPADPAAVNAAEPLPREARAKKRRRRRGKRRKK